MAERRHLRELLASYTALLNQYGPDSPEARDFLKEHKGHAEFIGVADLARHLKITLTTDRTSSPNGGRWARRRSPSRSVAGRRPGGRAGEPPRSP
jgi:hypothetical protein